MVRTQEGPPSGKIENDLVKGYSVGEKKDVRVNYGFTEKIDFATAYKAWEMNPESMPLWERIRSGCDKELSQVVRRICAFVMNKVAFTAALAPCSPPPVHGAITPRDPRSRRRR